MEITNDLIRIDWELDRIPCSLKESYSHLVHSQPSRYLTSFRALLGNLICPPFIHALKILEIQPESDADLPILGNNSIQNRQNTPDLSLVDWQNSILSSRTILELPRRYYSICVIR